MNLLERLESEILCADGAMGTLLLDRGAPPGSCLEALCVDKPEIVTKIHADYAAAGASIVRTNSFGANAIRLAAHGRQHQVNEINWLSAQIARQAVKGSGALVAGSVGPLCAPEVSLPERAGIFREQIGALLDGGAQIIFFETFQDLEELLLALEIKQSLHHCPAVCSLTFDESACLPDGTTMEAAFDKLRRNDAELIGINCTNGPDLMLRLLARSIPAEPPLAAFPNAGAPTMIDGKPHYDLTPKAFAQAAVEFARLGTRIIGGCCGTTPAHIAELRAALVESYS